jgi:hypothetical protein
MIEMIRKSSREIQMKNLRILIVFLLTISMLLVDNSKVLAVPPLPSSFYGTVKSNGANVPIGILVSARINGVQYASKAAFLDGLDTVYFFDVPGDDPSTPGIIEGGITGDTVEFYVGNTKADQTATWKSGANVNLNLTVALPDYWQIFLPLIFH